MKDLCRVAILGASGYAGAELAMLLSTHPFAKIEALSGHKEAGKEMADIHPGFLTQSLPALQRAEEIDWHQVNCVFSALEHGVLLSLMDVIPNDKPLIDLSGDHRHLPLTAMKAGRTWQYGLTEIFRDQLRAASSIANPGCYPTSILLPLIPLLSNGLIDADDIIVSSVSGLSGVGRKAALPTSLTESAETFRPYSLDVAHRHEAEIDKYASHAHGGAVSVAFLPHVSSQVRGIVSTLFLRSASHDKVRECLQDIYNRESFVHVLTASKIGQFMGTRMANRTNNCVMAVTEKGNRTVIVSAIDNVVKGAAGQAVQNFNLIFGFDEGTALPVIANI